jgi:uncharacterized membrane-anchored protein
MNRTHAPTALGPGLNHPQRLRLAAELHARPFIRLAAPACISHLAIHCSEDGTWDEHLLTDFCARFGVAAPGSGAQHFFHDFGHFGLKWERLTEFSTYTFIESNVTREAFAETPMRHVPHDWLSGLAARMRSMSFHCGYRFSAAQADHRIVRARIGELREKRIEGVPTVGELMDRHLAPAMDTCVGEYRAGATGEHGLFFAHGYDARQARSRRARLTHPPAPG